MKNYAFTLLICSCFVPLHAQYDFPATINGISIGLELNGEQTVFATNFLSIPTDPCSDFGEVLISRSTLQFPRGSQPPASAAASIVFDCTDFGTESVEIWYQDRFGNWLVADSYVVIFGLDADCGSCEGDDCQSSSPQLYNGYSISFPGGSETVSVSAREIVSRAITPGETFSFTPSPTDTVQVFSCSDNSLVPVLVYSHLDGFTSLPASTYIALATGEACGGGDFTGAASRVMQGLSVPNSSAEIVTVPARAFAPRNGPAQQLSFSENPTDTLFTLTCEQIGAGGVFINVYNHLTGTPGPPALTYITGDDTQNHCGDGPENTAANDSIVNAFALDSCRTFHQFTKASVDESDFSFSGNGTSVWHVFSYTTVEAFNIAEFYLEAIDSVNYAIFIQNTLSDDPPELLNHGTTIGLDTLFSSDCIVSTRNSSTDNIYVQLSSIRNEAPTRYFISARSRECPSAINEVNIATLKSYPNPTHGMLNINLPTGLSSRATISIFDQLGRIVQQQFTRDFERTASIDLMEKNPGIYYVRISDGKKQWVSKVVLTR